MVHIYNPRTSTLSCQVKIAELPSNSWARYMGIESMAETREVFPHKQARKLSLDLHMCTVAHMCLNLHTYIKQTHTHRDTYRHYHNIQASKICLPIYWFRLSCLFYLRVWDFDDVEGGITGEDRREWWLLTGGTLYFSILYISEQFTKSYERRDSTWGSRVTKERDSRIPRTSATI